jgi:hypothetical protein
MKQKEIKHLLFLLMSNPSDLSAGIANKLRKQLKQTVSEVVPENEPKNDDLKIFDDERTRNAL